MRAKKTSKNQLTLPKEIARAFPDTEYFDVSVKDKQIVLTPAKTTPADMTLEDMRDKMVKLGINEGDVAEAVRWARKKKSQ